MARQDGQAGMSSSTDRSVPTGLRTPPTGRVALSPPVVTKAAYLPLQELPWSDVERLFLRLAEREGRAECAELYGTEGQGQEGIDLFVRNRRPQDPRTAEGSARRYTTLQSKRVRTLGPAAIGHAVDRFLGGTWADRSEVFIYATTHALRPTRLADALNAQADRLEDVGIRLVRWGLETVSEELRGLPEIVDDFFGRAWVEAFCGAGAALSLSGRLPGQDLAELRRGLRRLYGAAFAAQDTGSIILGAPHTAAMSGPYGYVPLDMSESRPDAPLWAGSAGSADPAGRTADGGTGFSVSSRPTAGVVDPGQSPSPSGVLAAGYRTEVAALDRMLRGERSGSGPSGGGDSERTPADVWLARGDLSLVSGPPGAGKSSLLRFVVLDLLADAPQSPALAERFGGRLPLWLPFPFLCAHVSGGSDRSVISAARAWLTRHSADHLQELIVRALDDDRLMLVVDGLDEWADEAAAQPVIGLLDTFVKSRNAAAILSSRPYALRRLGAVAGWRWGQLAPLTRTQQESMARAALAARTGTTDDPARFLEDVHAVADLRELLKVPLFLLMLVATWSRGSLPTRRLHAHRRLVDLLLELHPAVRSREPRSFVPEFDRAELRQVLGAAAFALRQADPGSVHRLGAWRRALAGVLGADGPFGYPEHEAARLAARVLETARTDLGIVVQNGPGMLGFAHAAVADQLAAEHIMTLDLAERRTLMIRHGIQPSWREVLLAVLAGQESATESAQLMTAAFEGQPGDVFDSAGGYELAAEALAHGVRLAPHDLRRIARLLCHRVETHDWMLHRARLLSALTGALAEPGPREVLLPWFARKVIERQTEPGGYWQLHRPAVAGPQASSILLGGLRHPSRDVSRACGQALVARFGGTPEVGERLGRLVLAGSQARVQGAALDVLTAGWAGDDALPGLIDWGRSQGATPVRVAALHAAKAARPGAWWTPAEQEWLLGLLDRDEWHHDGGLAASDLVAEAARGQDAVRDHCFGILSGTPGSPGLPGARDLAWSVLLAAFSDDRETIRWMADRLASENVLTHSLAMAPERWADEPLIRGAAEQRLLGDRHFTGRDALALTRLSRTVRVRGHLLAGLDADFGWGITADALATYYSDDERVRAALVARVMGEAERAASLAPVMPGVLGPVGAMARLSDLVRERPRRYLTHAIAGLGKLWMGCRAAAEEADGPVGRAEAEEVLGRYGGPDLARLCLDAVPSRDFGTARGWIIGAWPEVPEVRAYAERCLDGPEPEVGAVLVGYGRRPGVATADITSRAAGILSPLEPSLRSVAVQQLHLRGVAPEVVAEVLRGWREESDPDVRGAAAATLARGLRPPRPGAVVDLPAWHRDALERLRTQCREDLLSYDLGDDRRRTAWLIMLLLEDLSLLDGLVERSDGRPVTVEYGGFGAEADPLLTELIAAHWDALQGRGEGALADRLAGRLHRPGQQPTHVWSQLAAVADRYPAVERALTDAVRKDGGLLTDRRVLSWYLRRQQEVERAVGQAIKAAEDFPGDDAGPLLDLMEDTRLRARHGRTLREEIGRAARRRLTADDGTAPVLTGWQRVVLARYFPEDPLAEALYRRLEAAIRSGRADGWTWLDAVEVTIGLAPARHLPVLLVRVAGVLHRRGMEAVGPDLAAAAAHRLRRDPAGAEAVASAIVTPGAVRADTSLWASTDAHGPPGTTEVHAQVLLAAVLATAVPLPEEVLGTLTSLATHDGVLHDNALMAARPVRLAALDLLSSDWWPL
ncbi:NACHT domain-containing protein [Streptomyces goshikiensis]|uniref:NACHT domain-containing protein n=1 Tax=Streptomyces goshikiensis TaxID=1942 RepID=UPI0036572B05